MIHPSPPSDEEADDSTSYNYASDDAFLRDLLNHTPVLSQPTHEHADHATAGRVRVGGEGEEIRGGGKLLGRISTMTRRM